MQFNQRTIQFAYFGIPAAVFVAFRVFGGGAQTTHAAGVVDPQMETALPPLITEISLETGSDPMQTVGAMQGHLSPFWFDRAMEITTPMIEEPVEYTKSTPLDQLIRVTAILPHDKRPLAVINGKPCKLGEFVIDGWKLIRIDGESRTVTVENAEGKSVTILISR